MALLSILVLVAIKMHETKKLVVQETTSWYDKKGELPLGDIIMIIRRSIWVKLMAINPSRRRVEFQCLMIKDRFRASSGRTALGVLGLKKAKVQSTITSFFAASTALTDSKTSSFDTRFNA